VPLASDGHRNLAACGEGGTSRQGELMLRVLMLRCLTALTEA
jgi:hypothetical protein